MFILNKMKEKSIIEKLYEHQSVINKLMDQAEDDHSKIALLKKHLDLHHDMIDRLMNILMLDVLMSNMQEYRTKPSVWKDKLKLLKEVVQHHLNEEKQLLYPEAEKHIPRHKLYDLGTRYATDNATSTN